MAKSKVTLSYFYSTKLAHFEVTKEMSVRWQNQVTLMWQMWCILKWQVWMLLRFWALGRDTNYCGGLLFSHIEFVICICVFVYLCVCVFVYLCICDTPIIIVDCCLVTSNLRLTTPKKRRQSASLCKKQIWNFFVQCWIPEHTTWYKRRRKRWKHF